MTFRTGTGARAGHGVWPALLALALLAACGGPFPQSTLIPKGDFAQMVDEVFSQTVRWAIVVFVVVEGALLFAIFKYRHRPHHEEPEQTHGNTLVEVVWTIIPAAILTFIAVPTVQTIFRTNEVPDNALQVEVIGHQWWWEFRYPAEQIVTANEMHVPAGRPVVLRIRTVDVLHAFWVPQLAAKRDAFHNRYTTLFFTTDSLGEFTGQCTEFCGTQHARMGSMVVVQTPEEYAAWVDRQRVGSPLINGGMVSTDSVQATPRPTGDSAQAATAVQDSIEIEGRQAFMAGGCIGCHAMVGTPTAGVLGLQGPNLSHLGGRRRLAAGVLPNTPENLARWLRDPQGVKPGNLMKLPRQLTEDEISALVAYLRAHQ